MSEEEIKKENAEASAEKETSEAAENVQEKSEELDYVVSASLDGVNELH